MTFTSVAIVGAGTMGRGIAQLLLEAGGTVLLHDADSRALSAADAEIRARLQRRAERGALSAPAATVAGRLRVVDVLPERLDVDLALECVPERLDLKRALLQRLDAALPAGAVLASNTSGLDVAALAAATTRPTRVLGIHFFNPPPVMALVEVVPAPQTDAGVVDAVLAWLAQAGKTPIRVANRPGFVVNRLLFAMIVEAMRLVEEDVASAADIDTAMRLGAQHPIGPLALADFIGLDVVLDILESLEARLGARYAPPQRLRDRVAAGHLGRKSGSGYADA